MFIFNIKLTWSKKWYWAFKAFHMCNRITSSSFSWFRNSSFHCSKPWIPLEKLTLQISRPITSCWRYFIIPLDRTLFVRKVTAWALIFVMILFTACDSCLPMLKHLATEVASRHSWELDGKHLRCLHYPLGKVQNLESNIHTKKNPKKNTASKSNLRKLKSSNGVGNYIVTDPTFLCCKKMKSGLFISGFKPVVRKRKI